MNFIFKPAKNIFYIVLAVSFLIFSLQQNYPERFFLEYAGFNFAKIFFLIPLFYIILTIFIYNYSLVISADKVELYYGKKKEKEIEIAKIQLIRLKRTEKKINLILEMENQKVEEIRVGKFEMITMSQFLDTLKKINTNITFDETVAQYFDFETVKKLQRKIDIFSYGVIFFIIGIAIITFFTS